MKKLLLFAAAALCLSACSSETTEELALQQTEVITRADIAVGAENSKNYYQCYYLDEKGNVRNLLTCHLNETKNEGGFEEKCALHGVDPQNPQHLHCAYCYSSGFYTDYGGLVFNVFDPELSVPADIQARIDAGENPKDWRVRNNHADLDSDTERAAGEFGGNLYWHYYYVHKAYLDQHATDHNGGNGFGI